MAEGAVWSQAGRDLATFSTECYLIHLKFQIDDEPLPC
jgi:hypothetical protein